jgi:MFS family permease
LIAFSVGSFLLAPLAVPLAQRYGRLILASGALLLALGVIGVDFGAHEMGTGDNPWPLVPGLVVAGAGLALLVIPLVNVVLAAVPAEAAGGASGLFGTAQQLGGTMGIALLGTIFFGYLGAHSFSQAFTHTAPLAAAIFLASGVLTLILPNRAVGEEELVSAGGEVEAKAS